MQQLLMDGGVSSVTADELLGLLSGDPSRICSGVVDVASYTFWCPNAFPRVPLPFGGLFCPAGPDPGWTGALCSDALVCLEARCEQTAAAPHLSFTIHWFLLQVELLWALNEGTLHSSFLLYLFPQAEEEVQMGSSLFHASCRK